MSSQHHPQPNTRDAKRVAVRSERFELLENVQSILEPAMTALGFCFLVLLLLDYTSTGLSTQNQERVGTALQVIWVIFLVDFIVRFLIAPAKGEFLRQNWFAALSLGLPFLRPFRAFRAVRVLRSMSLVRLLGGINRGIRVLRKITRGRQFAYVGGLTVLVMLAGAVGVLYFDRDIADAPIQTFGDALWWSAAMVTTINNEKYVVSTEARIIAILIRVFAVSVFGFITASIATYLIGSTEATGAKTEEDAALREEIATLRRELALVREGLAANGRAPDQPAEAPPNVPSTT
ncbi:MAG TPA: ion transporter [Thermomicrobiales bacterium]|nr:ion transporter [Thermomicrobiales bacterium]